MIPREVSPALVGSLALHAAVAAALLISWRFTRDLQVGSVVPVTIVSGAPAGDLRPTAEAAVEQTAQTEEPLPQASPESAALPQPEAPLAAPAAAAPTAPAKPQPQAKADKGLDLDALAASLSRLTRPAGAKPSSAAKGPPRPETAQQARAGSGTAEAAAALSGLTEELQRRWNPNCEVEGGRDVQVRVSFVLGAGGGVVGDVASEIRGAQNPVSRAGAERAVRAVYAAAPFRDLPRQFYGDRITVNFNAREACS